jgi:tripartite-type tricarboxylate transporter receptor subunit TctC
MKSRWFVFLGLMVIAPIALGQAKDYPNRTVKIISMTTPGTTSDQVARLLAQPLSGIFGQPFVVENRPGGDGVVGVMTVKNAPADGYTILMASVSPMSVNPVVKKDLPYDPTKDLKPVCGLLRVMNVLTVAGDSKLNTLADLVNASKKADHPLSVGTSFAGYHLDMEWFASLAGIKFNQIPYKGSPQVLTDVIGHQIDIGFGDRSVVGPLLKSGKLKALAVAGETRFPDSPEVPTVMESGYPGFTSYSWIALFVRSETPDDVVAKLDNAVQKIMVTDTMKNFMKLVGGEPFPLRPVAMRKYQLEDIERYRRSAEAAGIKPE